MSETPNPTAPFAEQLEAARGSASALGELLENCRHFLLAYAERNLESGMRPKLAASDIVQETILKASEAFSGFRGNSTREFRSWLRTILIRTLVDCHRTSHWRQFESIETLGYKQLHAVHDPLPTPRGALDQAEVALTLEAALKRLPHDYRTVIQLRHHEKLSFREIGNQIGRSTSATKRLWMCAVVQLRNELED